MTLEVQLLADAIPLDAQAVRLQVQAAGQGMGPRHGLRPSGSSLRGGQGRLEPGSPLGEDLPLHLALIQQALEREGYSVLVAANGVQALQLWEQRSGPIHLLFTDMVMPEGVSGPQLATQLRARDPGLKVIYTSGYTADLAPRDLPLVEGVNFVQKPVALQQLLATIGTMLDSADGVSRPPAPAPPPPPPGPHRPA